LVVMTPGGAGIGEPAERDRVQVANDLADGLISDETAEKVYAYKPPRLLNSGRRVVGSGETTSQWGLR
jgi:N-methylhydantoinase B/oxoprolinase/acetone carboxylase alpha subunit